MFLFVSPRAKAIAAAVAIGGWALVAPAFASNSSPTASSKGPTRAQIRAAIHRALHSRFLWATVNICDTKHHPNVIGIRGQMPSLSFAAGLRMTIQVDYWSTTEHRYVPAPGAAAVVQLGRPKNSIIQGGATFTFQPPVRLSGTIEFQWMLHGKAIGHTTRATSSGDKQVAYGDPPGHSAASCRMPKRKHA
jgi:hypothetical protein